MANQKREMAFRIFADEFNHSKVKITGNEKYAPNYVVSPLGAKMNRVFVVGVLMDVENRGDEQDPFYLAKVSDTAGTFHLSAGQYNPEAAAVLGELSYPSFVAIVGKVRGYEPEDGGFFLSISPETIKVVDEKIRNYWCVKTAQDTLNRIKAYRQAREMDEPSFDGLKEQGYTSQVARGALLALEKYGEDVNVNLYFKNAVSTISMIAGVIENKPLLDQQVPERPHTSASNEYLTSFEKGEPEKTAEGSQVVRGEQGDQGEQGENTSAMSDDEMEKLVLEVILQADENDVEKDGALWDDIKALAREKNISETVLNNTMESLHDDGLIFEPIVGRIKRI